MANLRTWWNLFLYAGVDKEEYEELLDDIREENRALLNLFSKIGAVMFLLLFAASNLSHTFASINSTTYLLYGIEMLLIMLCARVIPHRHPVAIMALVYVFEITLYMFGINISMLHAEKVAVSAVAFLLVSPLLFYDRPIRLSALIVAVVCAFCAIVVRFKAPEVAETDVWNSVTFGVVAIASTVFVMRIKVRDLAHARQITYMSQTDLLTGAKNRNHYENRLKDYPALCSTNLICVYADVNGLHEMNNRYGHPAGDAMLREVAEVLQQCFGEEHTYRVGGDEFVAFRIDGQPDTMSLECDQLRRALAAKGYHVSFGVAVREKAQGELNMYEMVNEAETNMFAAKRAFYRQSGNDRGSR